MPVIEYYNGSLDHYFITWIEAEIALLEAGTQIKGWVRRGQSLEAYTTAQAGTSPVCRFYIPPALGDSHLFGRGPCYPGRRNRPFRGPACRTDAFTIVQRIAGDLSRDCAFA